ncbi:MAG: MarR family winged helix-turn-helix transcriptional regulator [Stellaceae bacterium]
MERLRKSTVTAALPSVVDRRGAARAMMSRQEGSARHMTGDFHLSRRILVLANLLKRGGTIRYRRLLELSVGEWGIIGELSLRAPLNLNELAAGIGLDKAQISRSVTSLVKRGLVTREPNPDSNREVAINLTAKGRRSMARMMATAAAVNDFLLGEFSADERRVLSDQIDLLTTRAHELLAREQAARARDGPDSEANDRDPGFVDR